jgi:hypothetical protein
VVDRAGEAAIVTFTCSAHVRGRVCLADIRTDRAHLAVAAEQHDEATDAAAAAPALVLVLEPLFSQTQPILDLVMIGSRLIVLDPSALTHYERTAGAWRATASRSIAAARPWPRDVRGRINVEGARIDAYLPGLTCVGTLDPLTTRCEEGSRAWPIGVANAGIPAGRNTFADAGNTPFFSGTALRGDAGARSLLVLEDHRWIAVDVNGRSPIIVDAGTGPTAADDVAPLVSACTPNTIVVASARTAAGGTDALRAFTIADRRLTSAAPPVVVPGEITALWSTPDPARVLVVVRNGAKGTHDAFHATLACGR